MLAKLMKHEFKATSRLLVPLYLILLGISIVNHFTFQLQPEQEVLGFIIGLLFMAQMAFIMVILAVTVIFMITRFYKNFLSSQGYLMFTLPVKTHQLVLSKLIITLFWIIVYAVGAAISWFVVVGSINDISLITFITETVTGIFTGLNTTFGLNWITIFVEIILLAILYLVGHILLVYLSIAVGQLYSKHKIIASFVSYAIFYTIVQIIMFAGMIVLSYNPTDSITLTLAAIILLASIGSTILYMTTNYIFKTRLNLQ